MEDNNARIIAAAALACVNDFMGVLLKHDAIIPPQVKAELLPVAKRATATARLMNLAHKQKARKRATAALARTRGIIH